MDWQATGIATISFSALLAAFAWFYRTREERRQTLNVALYHLLELWRQISFLTVWKPEEVANAIIAEFRLQAPGIEVSPEEQVEVASYLGSAVQPMFSQLLSTEERSAEHAFEEILQSIARVAPVLAVRLRGNTAVKASLAGINDYLRQAEAHLINSSPDELPQFRAIKSTTHELFYEEALADLERDLRTLSRKAGLGVWLRTTLIIRRRKRQARVNVQEVIRPFFGKLVPHLQASLPGKSPASK